ncbi:MAG: hypothetical protein WAZ21_01640 [Candidatus Saccharimonadales bacterium]
MRLLRYAYGGILSIAALSLLASALLPASSVGAATYSPNLQGARDWANVYCPDPSYKEDKIADFMWITGPGGGTDMSAVRGGSDQVDITINFVATYCSNWPKGYINGAKQLSVDDANGTNRLIGGPGAITYEDRWNRAGIGIRDERGVYPYAAKLNVSGWETGLHEVCTGFGTTTNRPGATFSASPNACFNVNFTRIDPWTTDGRSLIGVNASPNVVNWPADPPGAGVPTQPGSVLKWNHRLWNNSGYNMTRTIYWSVRQSGFSGGAGWRNGSADPQGWNSGSANGSVNSPFVNEGPAVNATQYTVTQDDVGNKLCQWLVWTPQTYDTPIDTQPTGMSPKACTEVPYNFNLSPSIGDLGMDIGDQDGTIPSVRAIVANSGPTKSYVDIRWQLSKTIVRSGNTIPKGADNRQESCEYYGNECTSTEGRGSGSGDTSFGVTSTTVSQLLNQPIGDLEVGDQVCYGLSITAYRQGLDNNSGEWRHSAPQCVIVGKKPKVQIWGSDLSVGRRFDNDTSAPSGSNVDVSTSIKAGNTKVFGSWVEYGVFATGTITGGSAAGLAGQDGHGPGTQADWSKLTFANAGHTPVSGCNGALKFGCYATAGNLGTIPNVAARLAPKAVTSTPSLSGSTSLDSLNDTYYVNGNLQITGGAIAKGRSVVIKASGTVFIDGDIRYTTDSLASTDEIPQVVIIANSIQIKDTVTNVDAWLIANGTQGSVHTCNNRTLTSTPVLTSGICDKKLIVNGPVMAKKLYLTRTAGSGTGTASGEPGEVLNLRADAYLWAIGRAGGEGSVQTIDTRELAPRF